MKLAPYQFIITNQNIALFENGINFPESNLNIQISEEKEDNLIISEELIFFGEWFDYLNPSFSNKQIATLFNEKDFDQKVDTLNRLTGFFVLILFSQDSFTVFNDAASQCEVYIYQKEEIFFIASQPTLIPAIVLKNDLEVPDYILEKKINIFGKTPFKNTIKLIPNFYYDLKNRKSMRFYPKEPLLFTEKKEILEKSREILKNILESISKRRRIALPVTAGWDTRILFASSLGIEEDRISYYVLDYKNERGKVDVEIAGRITSLFHKKLRVIEYDLSKINLPGDLNYSFWKNNLEQLKRSLLRDSVFPDSYIIDGGINEVVRNFYDPLPKYLKIRDFCFILGIQNGNYERDGVEKWIKGLKGDVNVLDLLYWENRLPNWAAGLASVSNVFQTSIPAFNNRLLLNTLLSSERKERDKNLHDLYKGFLRMTDKRLSEIPINPTRKHRLITFLKKARLYKPYRILFFKLRLLQV